MQNQSLVAKFILLYGPL